MAHWKRGRPIVRWKDRGKEYMHEKLLMEGEGLNKQGRSVRIGRGEGSYAVAMPLWDIPGGNEV